MVRTLKNPDVPFVALVDTDWIQKIKIKGEHHTALPGVESEPEEVAFVFDARFCYGGCENKIVTNCKIDGAWQAEEDGDCPFPFYCDVPFKIKIICDEDSFKVKVDNEDFLEYEQKLSDKTINCLRIENDIILDEVKLV